MAHAVPTSQISLGFTDSGADLETFKLRASTQSEVLGSVASTLSSRCPRVDERAVLTALAAREREESSHVGDGIALPHASVDGLDAPLLIDVSLERPVLWGRDQVSRCMVLLVPRGDAAAHLGLAADAARRAGAR
ncbi:MAG: PTS sugar transporter subunit IIA [Myxococcota bacterium]